MGIKPLGLVALSRDEIDLLLLGRLVVDNDGPAQAVLPGRDDVAGHNFLAVAGPAGQQQKQQTWTTGEQHRNEMESEPFGRG